MKSFLYKFHCIFLLHGFPSFAHAIMTSINNNKSIKYMVFEQKEVLRLQSSTLNRNTVIEKTKDPLKTIFVDIKKACNMLDQSETIDLLKKYGLRNNIYKLLQNLRGEVIILKPTASTLTVGYCITSNFYYSNRFDSFRLLL